MKITLHYSDLATGVKIYNKLKYVSFSEQQPCVFRNP